MSVQPLRVASVSKRFAEVVAVDDVSFGVARGEVFGLLGPNGAGKTTLLRMCVGILRPDEGELNILGETPRRELLDRVAYLPEERGLYMGRRVRQVVQYLGELKGLPRDEVEGRARTWLERIGIGGLWDEKVSALSKGNRQKVQIAACLMSDPDLLIFDEPFTGLDPVNSRVVAELVRDIASEGVAVLLSTHQMARAEDLCDRVGLIANGRIVRMGSVAELTRLEEGRVWTLQCDRDARDCGLIERVVQDGARQVVTLKPGMAGTDLLRWLSQEGVDVQLLQSRRVSLDEVFVREIGRLGGPEVKLGTAEAAR